MAENPVRNCPRCSTAAPAPMMHVENGAITLDVCPTCGGLWLDEDEWKPIVGSVRSIDRPKGLAMGFQRTDCPACGHSDDDAGLVPRGLRGLDELEIDVCARCNGAWLDRGELDHARKAARLLGDERRRLAQQHHQSEHEKGRGPAPDSTGGFLDALVDTWQKLTRKS